MKKFLVLGAVMALAVLAILDFREQQTQEAERRLRPRGLEMRRQAAVGTWGLPTRRPAAPKVAVEEPVAVAVAEPEPVDAAQVITDKYLREHGEQLGLRPWHETKASVFRSPLGAQVNYQIFQDGLPILGAELRLQIGRDNVVHLENEMVSYERADLSSAMHPAQAAHALLASNYQLDPSLESEPSKVLVPVPGTSKVELAYVVAAREPASRKPVQVMVRASDGQVLGKNYSRVEFPQRDR